MDAHKTPGILLIWQMIKIPRVWQAGVRILFTGGRKSLFPPAYALVLPRPLKLQNTVLRRFGTLRSQTG